MAQKKRMTHLDDAGAARMVDVSAKDRTDRVAVAEGMIRLNREARTALFSRTTKKGDAIAVARVAGIMAAKKTSELIPLCHPLPLNSVELQFGFPDDSSVAIEATVRVSGKTGVEMEALVSASVAALTIYDMCKAVDRGMTIEAVRLEEKSGGRSGHFLRAETEGTSP